jgi:hypothetical protein
VYPGVFFSSPIFFGTTIYLNRIFTFSAPFPQLTTFWLETQIETGPLYLCEGSSSSEYEAVQSNYKPHRPVFVEVTINNM